MMSHSSFPSQDVSVGGISWILFCRGSVSFPEKCFVPPDSYLARFKLQFCLPYGARWLDLLSSFSFPAAAFQGNFRVSPGVSQKWGQSLYSDGGAPSCPATSAIHLLTPQANNCPFLLSVQRHRLGMPSSKIKAESLNVDFTQCNVLLPRINPPPIYVCFQLLSRTFK